MKLIKQNILQHLATVTESTAKKIAAAIGMNDYPSDVVKALGEMRTDAEIECEKRKGKGNELVYWLAKPVSATDVFAKPEHGNEVSRLRGQLADAEQIIANARQALAVKEGESLVLAIETVAADLVLKTGVIQDYQAKLGHARLQVDALNEQLMNGDDAVDVKDAARGYLVCAPKRKPAKLMKAESAVARAKSAAKATGRCEVFALVPVGIAIRKQIQAVEFKGRAA